MALTESKRQMVNKMTPKTAHNLDNPNAPHFNLTFRPSAGGADLVVRVEEKNIAAVTAAFVGYTVIAIEPTA